MQLALSTKRKPGLICGATLSRPVARTSAINQNIYHPMNMNRPKAASAQLSVSLNLHNQDVHGPCATSVRPTAHKRIRRFPGVHLVRLSSTPATSSARSALSCTERDRLLFELMQSMTQLQCPGIALELGGACSCILGDAAAFATSSERKEWNSISGAAARTIQKSLTASQVTSVSTAGGGGGIVFGGRWKRYLLRAWAAGSPSPSGRP